MGREWEDFGFPFGHVLGDGYDVGTLGGGVGGAEGVEHHFGGLVFDVYPDSVFGRGTKNLQCTHALVCSFQIHVARYGADKGDYWIVFRRGSDESRGKVGSSRAGSGNADSWDAGDATDSGGHEGGVLFVAGDYEFDFWVIRKTVEYGVDFGAWDAKDQPHAGIVEAVDDDLGDGV